MIEADSNFGSNSETQAREKEVYESPKVEKRSESIDKRQGETYWIDYYNFDYDD